MHRKCPAIAELGQKKPIWCYVLWAAGQPQGHGPHDVNELRIIETEALKSFPDISTVANPIPVSRGPCAVLRSSHHDTPVNLKTRLRAIFTLNQTPQHPPQSHMYLSVQGEKLVRIQFQPQNPTQIVKTPQVQRLPRTMTSVQYRDNSDTLKASHALWSRQWSGATRSPCNIEDEDWERKGGDSGMTTMTPILSHRDLTCWARTCFEVLRRFRLVDNCVATDRSPKPQLSPPSPPESMSSILLP